MAEAAEAAGTAAEAAGAVWPSRERVAGERRSID